MPGLGIEVRKSISGHWEIYFVENVKLHVDSRSATRGPGAVCLRSVPKLDSWSCARPSCRVAKLSLSRRIVGSGCLGGEKPRLFLGGLFHYSDGRTRDTRGRERERDRERGRETQKSETEGREGEGKVEGPRKRRKERERERG